MVQMTVARAMTRKKTIKAQLEKITQDIAQYGAINNKKLHILSDEKNEIKKNHREAQQKVESLYQQFNDLKGNFIKLTLAINKANLETDMIIADKPMKVAEALVYKNEIAEHLSNFKSAYTRAVNKASNDADMHNKNVKTEGLSEQVKKEILADVLYLVPQDRIAEVDKFLVEFLTEIDGTLNEINATTLIEVDLA